MPSTSTASCQPVVSTSCCKSRKKKESSMPASTAKKKQTSKPTSTTNKKKKPELIVDNGWEEYTDGSSDPPLPFQLPVFQESAGPQGDVNKDSTILDFFELFFPPVIMRLIETETNRYANSTTENLKRTNKLKKNSVWNNWKP